MSKKNRSVLLVSLVPAFLLGGVVAVRDMGGDARSLADLSRVAKLTGLESRLPF